MVRQPSRHQFSVLSSQFLYSRLSLTRVYSGYYAARLRPRRPADGAPLTGKSGHAGPSASDIDLASNGRGGVEFSA